MKDDDIDKIECLIGYLEYWTKGGGPKIPPPELASVVAEAVEWVSAIREAAK